MESGGKNRDSIDFGKTNIPKLFVKLFVPTLLGLVFFTLLNMADGIFVGKGVGSDALAAVNIAAPIFLISSAVSLMFATGMSVVVAIHLSHGNVKAANINLTQAMVASLLLMVLLGGVAALWPEEICRLCGGSDKLMPYVVDYLRAICLMPALGTIVFVSTFALRLDGSPNTSMYINIGVSMLNIFLDWLMVFPLDMGVRGAAMATSMSEAVGAVVSLVCMKWFSHTLRMRRIKLSRTSLRLTLRNLGYMVKTGLPTFIAETAIACMMVVGNFMFIRRLHEDGVAAFSVACYLFPLVFMFGNSIAQSQLPIISYNHGLGDQRRVNRTFLIALGLSVALGLLLTCFCLEECGLLMSLFLYPGTAAYDIAMEGFPLFTAAFFFFTLNVTVIGFYQSVEWARASIAFMLFRGLLLVVPCFVFLPGLIGDKGLWLAVPLSECLTALIILSYTLFHRRRLFGSAPAQAENRA